MKNFKDFITEEYHFKIRHNQLNARKQPSSFDELEVNDYVYVTYINDKTFDYKNSKIFECIVSSVIKKESPFYAYIKVNNDAIESGEDLLEIDKMSLKNDIAYRDTHIVAINLEKMLKENPELDKNIVE